jgi:hypothetical protein
MALQATIDIKPAMSGGINDSGTNQKIEQQANQNQD